MIFCQSKTISDTHDLRNTPRILRWAINLRKITPLTFKKYF
jgi:ribosomal protein L24E